MIFFRRAYKKSQKIFTVSEFSKSRIEYHLGKDKLVIVTYTGIRQALYNYKSNVKNIKKTETIVFIGNIKKHKGLDCLLDAFRFAKKECLPHKLIILGERNNFRTSDNAVLQKIELLGGESVMFTGFVSDEQLMEYVSQASLLVQPSLYEGFGLPPLEAMALGTPALVTDIPVFKEIYTGYPVTFFRAGDTDDLKNKLLEILQRKNPESPVLTKELSLRYTFEKTAKVILRELEA
jgi:glycosyltransferase involved in cell wall biosynthesis